MQRGQRCPILRDNRSRPSFGSVEGHLSIIHVKVTTRTSSVVIDPILAVPADSVASNEVLGDDLLALVALFKDIFLVET